MTHAELLRKHADLATREGGMYYSGEYLSRIAATAESLEAENAKLRERVDELEGLTDGKRYIPQEWYQLVTSENHKLRELVRDLWEACPADGYYCIYHCEHYDKESESHCKLEDRMAELGIEVDE